MRDGRRQEKMKGKIVQAIAYLLLIGLVLVSVSLYFNKPEAVAASTLKKFSSYQELEAFVKASPPYPNYLYEQFGVGVLVRATSQDTASDAPEHSVTNIQVPGVDEADIIKTDGEHIYLVLEDSVVIVKAYPPEEARILSQIELDGDPIDIFINGDRLVIFEQETSQTSIKIYDVSDEESPLSKREVSVDGAYWDSRMIGDYVYVVIAEPLCYSEGEVSLPRIYLGDTVEEISATEIYHSDVPDYSYGFTTIVALNTQSDDQEPAYETILLGGASNMYVSLNNIYITFPGWEANSSDPETIAIHRIHIENGGIEYDGSGQLPGRVLNQFSMDEHEGYLRVATTTGHLSGGWEEATSRNHLYILDKNLDIVGRLEGLAPGERIYSARFMGDTGYLVTFRKVDPLFVIDLSDPYHPEVLGELEITGYSDYLHPYDENHIIGIGKETIPAEQGDFSWYQGVKISLFDVSDAAEPREIAKYEIGERGTDSPVLWDHKALLFDKEKNLLVIPVLVVEQGQYVWQGAYVFDISPDEGIRLRGGITHQEDDIELWRNSVKRSLYIGNVLYTISDTKIKMNNLENLEEIGEVQLPPAGAMAVY
jgi:uncharacterized secreted protein with C-terminal beta-propeller domain